MRKLLLPLTMAAAIAMSGCTLIDQMIYTVDIQEGNLPPLDKIEQLKPGMTPDQVNYLLGSPSFRSLEDPGHWEYIYSLTSERSSDEYSRLTLQFENGLLKTINTKKVDKAISQ